MTELEDDLRIANRETVHVRDSTAQDESIVVEPEIGGIAKNDLPDLRPQARLAICDEAHPDLLRRLLHQLAEVAEASTEVKRSGLRISFASRYVTRSRGAPSA